MGGLVAACGMGGGGGESAAPAAGLKGAIRFSHLGQKPHPDVFAKLAAQFQLQNPGVTVAAEPTWSWDNAKYIAEAVGGDASDLVWTSENFVTPLYAKGIVREVDGFLSKDRSFKLSDYYDTVINAYKFRGKQIGMPVNFGAYVMHYNKTLFENAGRKLPDDTWTWDTFLDASKALTRPATDGGFGQYGFETRLHENVYSSWLWNAGGDLFNAEGNKPLFDKAESIAGMQYLVDLLHRHRVAVAPEVIQRQTGSNPYTTNTFGLTGKVAMVFNAIYFLPTYRQAEGLQQMEWDIAPIPKGPQGRTTTNPTAGVTMWSGSKSPDAAWAFMRYLVSEEASKTYVDMAVDGLPVHKGAADLVLRDARPPKSKQVYIDAYKYARPAFTTPYGQRAKTEYNNAIRPVFLEGGQVRQAVMEAVPKIQAALEEELAADVKK
ncbi:MAG: sugar ABC transporter substrate-binding protein [Chloroflexota bacterium]|nr:sugar ABC transporter substrate-binding protein [Chloroflexota bacterium]